MLYFNHNGKFYKEGTPVIGPDNRGVRYGDGLFETMKMVNGKLIEADEHFARLWNGLQVLQFELPKNFTPEKLQEEIIKLAEKNGHANAVRVRLCILRNDGGLYDVKNHLPNYIIQTWQLPDDHGRWNSNGLVLGMYEDARKSCDILSNLKHNNYLPYVLAALRAKKERWNDAVLLNTHGRVCDTTIANIFIVKDEVVFTPPLSEGCVAGIMRKKILQDLLENNFQVSTREITKEDLLDADEVFLSNSIYMIRWVGEINGQKFGNSLTQKISALLHQTI